MQIENCKYHNEQKIIAICLKRFCDNESRLACLQCILEKHLEHQQFCQFIEEYFKQQEYLEANNRKNLYKLTSEQLQYQNKVAKLQYLDKNIVQENNEDIIQTDDFQEDQMDIYQKQIIKSIEYQRMDVYIQKKKYDDFSENFKNKITEQVQQLKTAVVDKQSNIIETLQQYNNQKVDCQDKKKLRQNLEQDIKKIIDSKKIEQNQKAQQIKDFKNLKINVPQLNQDKLNKIQNEIKQIFSGINNQIIKNVGVSLGKQDFTFHPKLFATGVYKTSSDLKTIEYIKQDGNKRYALLSQPIEYGEQVKFKIVKQGSFTGVGVGYKKGLVEQNYDFNYSNKNYGGFFYSSNGYIWNCQEPFSQSNHYISKTFTTGDLVVVKYLGKYVEIEVWDNSQKKFQVKIKGINPNSSKGPIVPVVNCLQDSKITIIDD
ncbi:hypothetical protein PPERSA_07903 [Pseudocohnilembus persalinus]|uniref:SPRY domain-containing protein n=1 Tax=Pseudocohnilembus persalinus TaxID=266149 RepID=A0A0V0QX49_PSEPJ|nr:hypothetical protein PPERSA_07903 [Pseudocohnilembus persalinus]|eukprot:KRX06669.1 hypothetical protein PPERSA_07903 [Pseudocohnilembus persalinus]